jgi:membrane-associated protease RseP (regulator of RpoE activity)
MVALSLAAAAPGVAQTPVAVRDSARVYRFRIQRSDTNLVSSLKMTREQLQGRLDSLQHAFEEMGLDAPDRLELVRQLHALLSSLSDLSEIEQHVRTRVSSPMMGLREKRQLVGGSEMMAGPFRTPITVLQPGWIGINAEAPHERIVHDDSAFIRYFAYPEIVSVEPNSPAERVGIARGDQLIAYDGADLRDREINLTRLLQPAHRITVTVRRDGAERQFPVVVARPPARVVERLELSVPDGLSDSMPARVLMLHDMPRIGRILEFDEMDPSSAPVAGAKLAEIRSEDLGRIFGVSRGVLVTDVFSDPARESGLHGGDVIVRADGRDLTTVAQLRRIVAAHAGDRSVELEIVRQKKTRPLTLRW